MLLLTVTHTFKVNGPKLAHWSKWICITLQSCICSLLTSNWEVSTGRSLNSFLIISEITKQFVICSFIEDNETNLSIEKHTLRVLYDNLKKMFAKFGFDASFMWLFQFVAYLACIYRKFWRDCWQNFVWIFYLCVWLDLLHFVSR